ITLVANIVIGVSLGVIAGTRPGGKFDIAATFIATWGVATPGFWVAILLILVFSLNLGWFPAAGWVSPLEDPVRAARHMVLPIMALGLPGSAPIMRQTRSAFIEVMTQDYIRAAWPKGNSARAVIMRHALRNAMIPVITIAAFQTANL